MACTGGGGWPAEVRGVPELGGLLVAEAGRERVEAALAPGRDSGRRRPSSLGLEGREREERPTPGEETTERDGGELPAPPGPMEERRLGGLAVREAVREADRRRVRVRGDGVEMSSPGAADMSGW